MFRNKQTKSISTEKVETIIGSGTTLQGNIIASGTIRVDGRVNGEIQTESDVVVGETGHVHGIVKGRNITVAGLLDGNASAEGILHIVATGRVNGDIVVDSFIVEDGAKYKGNCQMKADVVVKEAERG